MLAWFGLAVGSIWIGNGVHLPVGPELRGRQQRQPGPSELMITCGAAVSELMV